VSNSRCAFWLVFIWFSLPVGIPVQTGSLDYFYVQFINKVWNYFVFIGVNVRGLFLPSPVLV
jgi:hypothetical protein